jgi:hypothetical protein
LLESPGHQVVGQQTGSNRNRTGGETARYRRSHCGDCWAAPPASWQGAADPRQQRMGRLELHFACLPVGGQDAVDAATWGFDGRSVTAHARRYPSFARRLRAQHGPMGSGPVWSRTASALRCSGPRDQGADRPAGHGKAEITALGEQGAIARSGR